MQSLKKAKGGIAALLLDLLAGISLTGDSEGFCIWSFTYEEPFLQCLTGDPVQEGRTWEKEIKGNKKGMEDGKMLSPEWLTEPDDQIKGVGPGSWWGQWPYPSEDTMPLGPALCCEMASCMVPYSGHSCSCWSWPSPKSTLKATPRRWFFHHDGAIYPSALKAENNLPSRDKQRAKELIKLKVLKESLGQQNRCMPESLVKQVSTC